MRPAFSAVLFAGGKSSRMRNDKAFLEFEGAPLWQRQLGLLEAIGPEQIFLAGPERSAWAQAGCEVIADARPDAGPLAGLVAGLRLCATPLLLALAVDLPRMTAPYLRSLLDLCQPERGVIPVTDRPEPLAAFYPRGALALAEEQLASGRYALQEFARRCLDQGLIVTQPISSAEAALFLNLNTPADLRAALTGP